MGGSVPKTGAKLLNIFQLRKTIQVILCLSIIVFRIAEDSAATLKYGYHVVHLVGTEHCYTGLPEVGNSLENRTCGKVTAGVDYCPDYMGRHFLTRLHYKAGVSYATPYYYIYSPSGSRSDGPKEFSASLGFGIPIINSWNNRSTLNISAQWARQSATGFIRENVFRINIGLTFNERWFAKWKLN